MQNQQQQQQQGFQQQGFQQGFQQQQQQGGFQQGGFQQGGFQQGGFQQGGFQQGGFQQGGLQQQQGGFQQGGFQQGGFQQQQGGYQQQGGFQQQQGNLQGQNQGQGQGQGQQQQQHPLPPRIIRGWELREVLGRLDKEIYDNAPGPEKPFIPELKNPCWAVGAPGDEGGVSGLPPVRCLPYAMIVGGFQSGAASLFQALFKHPMVVKSPVSRWHFWAEEGKTLKAYLDQNANASHKIAKWTVDTATWGIEAGLDPRQVAHEAAAAAAGRAAVAAAMAAQAKKGGRKGPIWRKPLPTMGPLWLLSQQKIIVDGSASTFAFYWSPGMRAHRAFSASMSACWKGCEKDHREGPPRDKCREGCFPMAREADRKAARNMGMPYDDLSLPLIMSAVYGRRPPKLVIMLRNPIERLYSAFWHYGHYQTRYGATSEGFSKYVNEQLEPVRDCLRRNGTSGHEGADTSCIFHFETWGLQQERLFFHADQILRGVYVLYLELWLKYFDPSTILIIRSEDYYASPVRTYMRMLDFLELDPETIAYHERITRLTRGSGPGPNDTLPWSKVEDIIQILPDEKLWVDIKRTLTQDKAGRYAVNRAASGGDTTGDPAADVLARKALRPQMSPLTRQQLQQFYAPYNMRLAHLLNDPSFIREWR
ncbi:hypothetical protein HYH03_003486 [Edaphochlamys debaryana]|uniref:Sulfotransferase domain-containing protein n=1 Tax=Edaphochlamys debaryana TaxID=47281 RepID=A0A836C4G4_9CHLO|nr:hypothetical protein HYH03_003486 [Edaphochlamys debaryana]|eukprot:KAG2498747.1 hypothetical protein HYH03_003486 [Edaphochlamys debaryana]